MIDINNKMEVFRKLEKGYKYYKKTNVFGMIEYISFKDFITSVFQRLRQREKEESRFLAVFITDNGDVKKLWEFKIAKSDFPKFKEMLPDLKLLAKLGDKDE